MSKHNLRLATDDASPRDPFRETLAAAIADLAEAERELTAARDASAKALELRMEAADRLEALQEAGKQGEDIGERFIASIRAGASVDAQALSRPSNENMEAIAQAEHDLDIWRRADTSCAAAIPAREQAVTFAKMRLERAVNDVIRNAGVVVLLLDGLAALENEVLARRLALSHLSRRGLIAESDVRAVKDALRVTNFPGDSSTSYFYEWDRHPVTLAWNDARAALMRDADAPLPQNVK